MKDQAEPQHHEQQTGTTETEKRQRHAGQREDAGHRADVDDHVCHDEAEHSGHDQSHRRVSQSVNHQQEPT